jgi:hypothetical protein
MSVNFPKPFSPTLHESFNKTGETAKAGDLLSAENFGVPPSYFGISPHVSAVRPAVRPSTLAGKTLLKTGSHGGKLRGLGREIFRGAKTMKNFHMSVQQSSLDNKKILKSVAASRKVAAQQSVKTI